MCFKFQQVSIIVALMHLTFIIEKIICMSSNIIAWDYVMLEQGFIKLTSLCTIEICSI